MRTRVLYDCSAFEMQTHGGVSKCFCELYKNLPSSIDKQMGVLASDNVHLQELGFPSINTAVATTIPYHKFVGHKIAQKLYTRKMHAKYNNHHNKLGLSINQAYCVELLQRGDFEVFHPSYYDTYMLDYIGNKPLILTVHDMIPELFINKYFPENDKQILDKKILIPRANHIIAVSENTKKDLMDIFNIPSERITVIYHGCDDFTYTPSQKSSFDFPYILYVGQRWSYKMFKEFAEECIPFLKNHPEVKIVCTSSPFRSYELAYLKEFGIANRIVHHFVDSDIEMYDLYHHAICFVYPSLYEGFGIPILEAYKADCPVLLSKCSCFPEIAGDAALYFEFGQQQALLSDRLEQIYAMTESERNGLIAKQRQRLQLYSWRHAAEQLAEVYLHYSK